MDGDKTPTNPAIPPPRIDITSPYYLGPHDRPGDFITPTRLRGENYDEWAGDIQTALEARRKFIFLDGTITSPSLPCTKTNWNTIHAMLISWLMNTIDPETKSTLSKYKDAKRLWDTLKTRFATVNGPRIRQLKSSISKCEQSKTMSVATYFGKLIALWEELNNHEPLIACSCCSKCTAGSEHEKRREDTQLHEFLMGLNTEYYAQTRSSILSQDPLPTLDRAYQLVVQDERVRLAKQPSDEKVPEAVGFALRTSTGRGKPEGSIEKKTGHLIDDCFEIKGYPDWWQNQSKVQGGGRDKSTQSGGKGLGSAHVNAAIVGSATSNVAAPSQAFTEEQLKVLVGFIGNTKIPDDRLNGPVVGADWNEC